MQKPRDFPCPRCGASTGSACEPIRQPSEHPSVLRDHPERGALPWVLDREGYLKYVMLNEDGDRVFLRRRPNQPPVTRPGWTTEPPKEVTSP
jgi:hypothetical protein